MAASKELVTKIVLKAQADGSISKAFSALAKNSDTCINKLSKIGQTATKVFKGVGVAVASGAVAAGKAAIDFESAFAGVQKTVDETNTTSYEDLSKGIRQMAKETPAAASAIADVAASAGQLGIKADDILSFSKTMIDLGESTNLTSDEAATSIAKLFNVTGTSMSQVSNFGSTLVALGNNAATTESDILAMATRIAGSGKQIGLTEQQILALSTSLSSVGIEAEMGGSAISTTMSKIDKDVASGSKTLSVWAKTAGMSTSQFSKAWNTDAYGALQKVMQGMANTKDEGGNLNLLLEDMGITAIRQGDTLKRLSSATGLMSEMTELANTSWSKNSALTTEANTRYATMASKLQIAKNKINDVGITVGNALLPVIDNMLKKMDEINWDAVAEKIVDKIQWVIDNFDKVKVAIGVLAGAFATFKIASFITTVAGAVKELKLLAGALKVADRLKNIGEAAKLAKAGFPALAGEASKLGATIGRVSGFLSKFSVTQALATAKQWLFNTSLYGCPIVLIIAGIAALIAIIVLLVKNWDKVSEVATKCWDSIKTGVSNAVTAVGNWFKQLPEKISNGLKAAGNFIKANWKTILLFLVNPFAGIFKILYEKCEGFRNFINGIGTWIKNAFNSVVQWLVQLPAKIGAFFQKLPYYIGFALGFVIGKVIQFGQKLWNFATVTIPQFIGKVVSWFVQLPGKIWTWLVNTWNKFVAWRNQMYAKALQIGKDVINAIVNFFKTMPGKIWTWLVNAWNKFVAWRNQMYAKALQIGRDVINAVVNFFKQLPGKVWTWLTNTISKIISWGSNMVAKGRQAASDFFNAVVNKIKELPGKLMSLGKNIVEGLWNGIKNAKKWLTDKIKSFASGITDGIKAALGINSPSVVMEKLFKWVPVGAGNGIIKNAKYAVNAVKSMGGKITSAASKISPVISASARLPMHGDGGTFTSPHAAIVGDRAETIVPHGNTPRNRSLLAEAARGVGATGGGNVINVTFAPVINGGNVEENRSILRDEEELFERKIREFFDKNRRLAF